MTSRLEKYAKNLQNPSVLHAVLPKLPVSINKLHRVGMHGKPVLSAEGKTYRADAINALKEAWLFSLPKFKRFRFAKYTLAIEVTLPRYGPGGLYTKGFPKTAKEPVQQRDASNFIKLIEDVIAQATGIDDRYNFTIIVSKKAAEQEGMERTEVWLELAEPISSVDRA
jgi:Holliday junction resolvase RusA-like endonuclease